VLVVRLYHVAAALGNIFRMFYRIDGPARRRQGAQSFSTAAAAMSKRFT